ncbi:sensor domain-containing diguanylate cyclase [Desulfocastanea catecholica]
MFFSILVTLIPSLGMGWFWYDLSHKATTEKVEKNLFNSVDIAKRETNLWFKERNYDLHVFADSFVVLDNLSQYHAASRSNVPNKEIKTASNLHIINNYLTLIRNQFTDYRRLLVLDCEGQIIAASDTSDQHRPVILPDNWKSQIVRSRFFTGDAYFIEEDPSPMIVIGAPLFLGQDSTQLGFFVMEVRLQGLLPLLKASRSKTDKGMNSETIILLKKDGRYILSTASPENHKETTSAPAQVLDLFKNPHHLHDFVDDRNVRVVGLAISFDDLPWGLLIAENYDNVFADLIQARNQIILITLFLTIIIGGTASIITSQIIIPLKSLTNGVLRVAGGDLDVSVNIHRNDELGIVTRMFNQMVCRLKKNRAALVQLATTDPLTKLANRKQIMEDLATNFEHYRRYSSEFSILMIDIDYFKTVNDTHGHLAGDAILVQLAGILKETLRIVDSAGRYGGEEFLVILGETGIHEGLQTAERIRQAVDQHVFTCEDVSLHITISIGLTGVVAEDKNGISLIDRADKALYAAKAAGRNRIFLASDNASISSHASEDCPA